MVAVLKLFKYYIDVITLISSEGSLQPLWVIWKDRRYRIEKITSVRETFSKAGGAGICYRCRFGDQDRNLFWERNRWFLESESYFPEMME